LFAVLPFWVTPDNLDDPHYGTGAPQRPRMWRKAAVTSAVAAVLWAGIYVLVKEPWISFRGG